MENSFRLTALLYKTDILRYTPAGVAVLDLTLQHESWQHENGIPHLIRFELPAKLIGPEAEKWQYRQGQHVNVSGFMAQRSRRTFRPVLHIQTITEYKG